MTAALGVRRVRVPFRVPFESGAGTWAARESLLVELRSEEGARGIGEAPIPASLATAALTRHVQALLDGPGEGVPEDIRHAFGSGLGGALLDLAPPPEPVFSAVRAGVGVNDTLGLAADAGELERLAAASVAAGFRTLKLKVGPRDDAAALSDRLLVVRRAAGDGVALRLDANGSWELEGAVARLRAVERFGIQYVEQPLPVAARGAMAQLRAKTGVPIAADEAVTSPEAALALVQGGAADVLVVKPARVGGPGAVAAIAVLAAEHGVPVVVSSLFETGIGLAAAVATAAALPDVDGWPAAERDHGLATSGLLEHDLLATPLVLEGGRIRAAFLPGSGGLGIKPDDAAIERYAVDDAA
jgi:o-succinylbenzoate synthase